MAFIFRNKVKMFYYVTLNSIIESYHMQKDGGWRKYEGKDFIKEGDFCTENPIEILDLQKINSTIKIDDVTYKVEPSTWSPGDDTMHYEIFGYREEYPALPSREQMDEVIAAGNDKERSVLALMIDGKFNLFSGKQHSFLKHSPYIVCRFRAWTAGGGYVGPAAVGEQYKSVNDYYYNSAIKYWVRHLETAVLDQVISEESRLVDNDEVFDKLYAIRENWESLQSRWAHQP